MNLTRLPLARRRPVAACGRRRDRASAVGPAQHRYCVL